MKGTIVEFLELAAERSELADELIELAAKYDFEFVDDELNEAELDRVAGGTTTDPSDMVMDRRAKFISTLSNIIKKLDSTQDTLTDNLK